MNRVQRCSELLEVFHHGRGERMIGSVGEELLKNTELGIYEV